MVSRLANDAADQRALEMLSKLPSEELVQVCTPDLHSVTSIHLLCGCCLVHPFCAAAASSTVRVWRNYVLAESTQCRFYSSFVLPLPRAPLLCCCLMYCASVLLLPHVLCACGGTMRAPNLHSVASIHFSQESCCTGSSLLLLPRALPLCAADAAAASYTAFSLLLLLLPRALPLCAADAAASSTCFCAASSCPVRLSLPVLPLSLLLPSTRESLALDVWVWQVIKQLLSEGGSAVGWSCVTLLSCLSPDQLVLLMPELMPRCAPLHYFCACQPLHHLCTPEPLHYFCV